MADNIYARMGRRMMLLRMAQGLSQAKLAEKTGIFQSYIARFESGRVKSIDQEKLEKIAEALGEKPETITGREPLVIEDPKDIKPAGLAMVAA